MIYETIYNKLKKIGILDIKEHATFKSEGFMDLHIDVLEENEKMKHISLAHNYIQNGDVMADPDMEILIHKSTNTAEALTFQQDPYIFQRIYDSNGKANQKLKKALNSFLNQWLTNIINQGHQP